MLTLKLKRASCSDDQQQVISSYQFEKDYFIHRHILDSGKSLACALSDNSMLLCKGKSFKTYSTFQGNKNRVKFTPINVAQYLVG